MNSSTIMLIGMGTILLMFALLVFFSEVEQPEDRINKKSLKSYRKYL
jgi:steroid 5-alpha reductase family enzyme